MLFFSFMAPIDLSELEIQLEYANRAMVFVEINWFGIVRVCVDYDINRTQQKQHPINHGIENRFLYSVFIEYSRCPNVRMGELWACSYVCIVVNRIKQPNIEEASIKIKEKHWQCLSNNNLVLA